MVDPGVSFEIARRRRPLVSGSFLSGHEGPPPPTASGGVCDGSEGQEKPPDLLPEPPLLFSWLFFMLCATPGDRKSPVHTRLGACPDPANTQKPDEPRIGWGRARAGTRLLYLDPARRGQSPLVRWEYGGMPGPHPVFATERWPPDRPRHQRCSIKSGGYLWKNVSIFGEM